MGRLEREPTRVKTVSAVEDEAKFLKRRQFVGMGLISSPSEATSVSCLEVPHLKHSSRLLKLLTPHCVKKNYVSILRIN